MSIESCFTFFKWTGVAAAILAALSTTVCVILSPVIDKKKEQKVDELISAKNQLVSQNKELSFKINTYQKDSEAKNVKINLLQQEMKKAKRGISRTYDFNGAKRDTRPGYAGVSVGPELMVFQTMLKFEQEKKYADLVSLCSQQIIKTPEWLTPYFFLGIAHANLGNKEQAIKQFEHVVQEAPDDPSYIKADEFLKKLRVP